MQTDALTPIASSRFNVTPFGKADSEADYLEVVVYKPEPSPRPDESGNWTCTFQLTGIRSMLEHAPGGNSLQALEHGLAGVALILSGLSKSYTLKSEISGGSDGQLGANIGFSFPPGSAPTMIAGLLAGLLNRSEAGTRTL